MGSTRALAGLAGVLLVVLLAAAGCGGGGGTSTTATTAATEQWANGVCSAVGDWKTEMESIATTLKNAKPSTSALDAAAASARKATQTLATTLKGLGQPETKAGKQAKASIDTLATQLNTSAKTIEDAMTAASTPAEVLTAVSTVSSTLVTMGTDVSSTVSDLQQLDATGELSKAFESADACKALRQ